MPPRHNLFLLVIAPIFPQCCPLVKPSPRPCLTKEATRNLQCKKGYGIRGFKELSRKEYEFGVQPGIVKNELKPINKC